MTSNERKYVKENIIDKLSRAVKQLQNYSVMAGEEVPITSDVKQIQKLLQYLDHAFLHGLRNISPGYWVLVLKFTRKDAIKIIKHLQKVTTHLGRGRAWIFLALNEFSLESYVRMIAENQQTVKQYYFAGALVRDKGGLEVLQTLAAGLEWIRFELELDDPYLDLASYQLLRLRSRKQHESHSSFDESEFSNSFLESQSSSSTSSNSITDSVRSLSRVDPHRPTLLTSSQRSCSVDHDNNYTDLSSPEGYNSIRQLKQKTVSADSGMVLSVESTHLGPCSKDVDGPGRRDHIRTLSMGAAESGKKSQFRSPVIDESDDCIAIHIPKKHCHKKPHLSKKGKHTSQRNRDSPDIFISSTDHDLLEEDNMSNIVETESSVKEFPDACIEDVLTVQETVDEPCSSIGTELIQDQLIPLTGSNGVHTNEEISVVVSQKSPHDCVDSVDDSASVPSELSSTSENFNNSLPEDRSGKLETVGADLEPAGSPSDPPVPPRFDPSLLAQVPELIVSEPSEMQTDDLEEVKNNPGAKKGTQRDKKMTMTSGKGGKVEASGPVSPVKQRTSPKSKQTTSSDNVNRVGSDSKLDVKGSKKPVKSSQAPVVRRTSLRGSTDDLRRGKTLSTVPVDKQPRRASLSGVGNSSGARQTGTNNKPLSRPLSMQFDMPPSIKEDDNPSGRLTQLNKTMKQKSQSTEKLTPKRPQSTNNSSAGPVKKTLNFKEKGKNPVPHSKLKTSKSNTSLNNTVGNVRGTSSPIKSRSKDSLNSPTSVKSTPPRNPENESQSINDENITDVQLNFSKPELALSCTLDTEGPSRPSESDVTGHEFRILSIESVASPVREHEAVSISDDPIEEPLDVKISRSKSVESVTEIYDEIANTLKRVGATFNIHINQDPLISTEISNTPGLISTEISNPPGLISTEISNTLGLISTEISNNPGLISTEISNTPGLISTEISNTTGLISTEISNTTGLISNVTDLGSPDVETDLMKSDADETDNLVTNDNNTEVPSAGEGSLMIELPLPTIPTVHESDLKLTNNNILQIMLDFYQNDAEQFKKMFQVTTGHIEGQVQRAFLMLSTNALYVLTRGTNKFVLHDKLFYSELDYVSTSVNYQWIHFAGVKRQQIWIDSADEILTRYILKHFRKVLDEFRLFNFQMDRHSISFLDDATIQKLTMAKWVSSQEKSNLMEVEIKNYTLIHWQEYTGSSSAQTSELEGYLYIKTWSYLYLGASYWTRKYFQMRRGILYQTEEGFHEPRVIAELSGPHCCGCRRLPNSDRQFAFEILRTDSSSIELAANSMQDLVEWQQNLCMAVSAGMPLSGGEIDLQSLPCCLIMSKTHIYLCHEDYQSGFLRCVQRCDVENVDSFCLHSPCPSCSVLMFGKSTDNNVKHPWILYFNSPFEREKFQHALSSAWTDSFQVELMPNKLNDSEMIKELQSTLSKIRGYL